MYHCALSTPTSNLVPLLFFPCLRSLCQLLCQPRLADGSSQATFFPKQPQDLKPLYSFMLNIQMVAGMGSCIPQVKLVSLPSLFLTSLNICNSYRLISPLKVGMVPTYPRYNVSSHSRIQVSWLLVLSLQVLTL